MPDIRGLVQDERFKALPPERKRAVLTKAGANPEFIEKFVALPQAQPASERTMAPGPEDRPSLGDIMAWREQSMDLGRSAPQTPDEVQAAGAGGLTGSAIAATAATAPMTPLGLVKGGTGMAGTLLAGNWIEKKLGFPSWLAEVASVLVLKRPRSALGRAVWKLGRKEVSKETKEQARKVVAREVAKEIAEGPSPTMGTTSRTAAPSGTLPARATLTGIPKAPKRPGIPRMMGGSKAQRAWMESQGLIPGAMGPDDVLAMKSRGATQQEVEAALLRASRPSQGWGSPTPKVGEKPANWKPSGPPQATKPKPTGGPTITGGTAGEATLSQVLDSVKQWKGVHKLSKPQIQNALREIYGIPSKEAREIIKSVL